MSLLQRIKSLIRNGFQTNAPSDSGDYPKAQCDVMGQVQDVNIINPYGLYSAPPKGSEFIVLSSRGNSDSKWGWGTIFRKRYAKNPNVSKLAEGEAILINVLTGSSVHMKADGSIDVFTKTDVNVEAVNVNMTLSGDLDVTANSLKLTGDLEVTGDTDLTGAVDITGAVATTGTITNNTKNIGYLHVHSGVTSGASSSGPPV